MSLQVSSLVYFQDIATYLSDITENYMWAQAVGRANDLDSEDLS